MAADCDGGEPWPSASLSVHGLDREAVLSVSCLWFAGNLYHKERMRGIPHLDILLRSVGLRLFDLRT
jgi:hypothetical protein